MDRKRKTHPLAFSLLELLAAIAVVTILTGIVAAGIRQVRGKSDGVKCAYTLRQIGVVTSIYMQDNSGHMPYGAYYDGKGFYSSWDRLLTPYWLDGEVVYDEYNRSIIGRYVSCPADTMPRTIHTPHRAIRSYAMVRAGGRGVGANTYMGPSASVPVTPTLDDIPVPGRTLYLAEYPAAASLGDGSDNFVWGTAFAVVDSPASQLGTSSASGLHGGKLNYLFVDGHVEQLDPRATIGSGSMSQPNGIWTISATD